MRVFFCGHPRVSAFVPVVSACGKQASSELTGTVSVSALAPLQAAVKSGIDDEDEMFKKLKYCANDPPVHQSKSKPVRCERREKRLHSALPPSNPAPAPRTLAHGEERARGRQRKVCICFGGGLSMVDTSALGVDTGYEEIRAFVLRSG